MGDDHNPDAIVPQTSTGTGVRRQARSHYHDRIYLALLLFVVIGGLPIVGVSSLRARFHDRIQLLRSAARGERAPQAPAAATIGEARDPFPKEYEKPQARPSYMQKFEAPPRAPYRIAIGGEEPAPARKLPGVETSKSKPVNEIDLPPTLSDVKSAAASDTGGAPQYRKGKSEQEAYDLVVKANATLAGMIQGADPALKFQDWSALSTGQDSYNVMIAFLQTADNEVRKYIWSVKVATKEVVPLSSYARGISK
jgi:hypothetical protein